MALRRCSGVEDNTSCHRSRSETSYMKDYLNVFRGKSLNGKVRGETGKSLRGEAKPLKERQVMERKGSTRV